MRSLQITHKQDLLDLIRQSRSLIRFVSDRHLVELLGLACADRMLVARIQSEYLLRLWLYSGGGYDVDGLLHGMLADVLEKVGFSKERPHLCAWLHAQRENRTYSSPECLERSASGEFVQLFRQEMNEWATADGTIVFVNQHHRDLLRRAVLLPFILEPLGGRHAAYRIRTANGEPLPGLDQGVRHALNAAAGHGIERAGQFSVLLTTVRSLGEELNLHGGSAALPVLLAVLRKHYQINIPLLECGATGMLTGTGLVDANALNDETLSDKADLFRQVGMRNVLMPGIPGMDDGWTSLNPGSDAFPVLKKYLFRQYADAVLPEHRCKSSSLLVGSSQELPGKLDALNKAMRYGTVDCGTVVKQLESLRAPCSGESSLRMRQVHVKATALMSAALCHLGQTDRSSALCRELLQESRALGPGMVLSLLIRQAVNLTDRMDYDAGVGYCCEALNLLNGLHDPLEKLDYEMQIRGTMGQALTYWALSDPAKKESARTELEKTCAIARELDEGLGPDDPRDYPRDFNYLCLWAALHDRDYFQTIWPEALQRCIGDRTSLRYLKRIRHLAVWRALLAGESDQEYPQEMDLPEVHHDWVYYTALKYRAFRNMYGYSLVGENDLAEAARLMEVETPLLAWIGAIGVVQEGIIRCRCGTIPDELFLKRLEQAQSVLEQHVMLIVRENCASADWFSAAEQIKRNEPVTGGDRLLKVMAY